MVTATVTSKGQITIPKAVRNSLRLRTGDRVEFVVQGRSEAVLKTVTRTVDEVFGILRKPGRPQKTIEEMDEAIARKARALKR